MKTKRTEIGIITVFLFVHFFMRIAKISMAGTEKRSPHAETNSKLNHYISG